MLQMNGLWYVHLLCVIPIQELPGLPGKAGHRYNTANLFFLSSSCRHARILSPPQVIEDQSGVHGQLAHLLGDTADPFPFDNTDRESPQTGDVFRPVPTAEAASVFIVVLVDDVVAAVFNGPMASVVLPYLLGRRQVRRFPGEARDNIGLFLATLFVSDEPVLCAYSGAGAGRRPSWGCAECCYSRSESGHTPA